MPPILETFVNALQHQDVARLRQIVRLDFRHPGNAARDRFRHAAGRGNVHHRQSAPDQPRLRIDRLEHARRHHADDAKLVHGV